RAAAGAADAARRADRDLPGLIPPHDPVQPRCPERVRLIEEPAGRFRRTVEPVFLRRQARVADSSPRPSLARPGLGRPRAAQPDPWAWQSDLLLPPLARP